MLQHNKKVYFSIEHLSFLTPIIWELIPNYLKNKTLK